MDSIPIEKESPTQDKDVSFRCRKETLESVTVLFAFLGSDALTRNLVCARLIQPTKVESTKSIFANREGLVETTHEKIPREPRISQKLELCEELRCLPVLKLAKLLAKEFGKCDILEIRLADCLSIFLNLNSEIGFRRYVQTDRFCGLGSGPARSRQRVQIAAQVPSLAIPARKSLTFPTTKSEPRGSASHM